MKCFKIVFIFSLILHFGFCSNTFAQGLNNNWVTGYQSQSGDPNFSESIINFQNGLPIITNTPMEMDFSMTQSNISDVNGNLLFYTNGYYIADASHDTMLNGSGINPSIFTSMFDDGLTIPQANIIIPVPNDIDKYYLIHSTVDNLANSTALFLYYSIIDITKNNGLGEVTLKNQILISDELNLGKIVAVKHGNGRDWWIICHKYLSNIYYKLLITPNGISLPDTQAIGIVTPINLVQQNYFSSNGDKFANSFDVNGMQILDFDRCTGNFSNPIHFIPQYVSGIGIAFSPNGKLIYSSAGDSLYQYDLTATNIAASQTVVAVWDSFLSGVGAFLPTWFGFMALAPDGNIYITTGNSTFEYHIVEDPDSLGIACNVIQHGLTLTHIYYNTLPNHPNYHLGPMLGSICDSITGIPPPKEKLTLKLYPNPNAGTFQLTYTPLPENLKLKVYNILGEEVHAQILPQWSQLQNIHIGNLPAGVYMASITSSKSKKSVKFVVE